VASYTATSSPSVSSCANATSATGSTYTYASAFYTCTRAAATSNFIYHRYYFRDFSKLGTDINSECLKYIFTISIISIAGHSVNK
jgi:hypothetical protein